MMFVSPTVSEPTPARNGNVLHALAARAYSATLASASTVATLWPFRRANRWAGSTRARRAEDLQVFES